MGYSSTATSLVYQFKSKTTDLEHDHYFHNRQEQTLPLIELVQKVQYPLGKGRKKGSSLVRTWLDLLLGNFQMEQRIEDFYSLKGYCQLKTAGEKLSTIIPVKP